MIADLKEREPNMVTPFVIVNFSHHKHLHLPKDHVVAFAEKDCNEGEVLEICTMEQLEKELPEIGYRKENGLKSLVNCSRTHSCKKTMTS